MRAAPMGVGTVVVTLGEKGALLHSAVQSTLIPAFQAGAVVETTGAGDAFRGSRHFSQCNELLEKQGKTPIDWRVDG